MKKTLSLLSVLAISAFGADNGITIINQHSPEFLLGKQTHVNMKFVPQDASDMWLKAGVRIQGSFENVSTNYNDAAETDTNLNDAYLRRVRFEVSAGFGKHTSFSMDVRNDKANHGINNDEKKFNVGDAYVKIKKPYGTSLVNFKLYRAKINISRTETVKSARVIAYDRPYVADAAAQYISFNRRGTNVQMYGDWEKKIHYQVAVGAGSSTHKIIDATGTKALDYTTITDQSFFAGGKIILSPFDGWEEKKRTETYFGKGKHFSIGASYWVLPTLKGTTAYTDANTSKTGSFDLSRTLVNYELSAHYKGFFVQAEYFGFGGMAKNWQTATVQSGKSTGWYATSEYVFTDLNYIAPFVRYESWNRFNSDADYQVTSQLAGINWYIRGNTTKVGLQYQKDVYAKFTGDKTVEKFRLVSQWFF